MKLTRKARQPRIIGGVMGLVGARTPPATRGGATVPGLGRCASESNLLYLANARSGVHVLNTLLRPQRLWLPSYLCPTLFHPTYPVKFYPVNEHLQLAKEWTRNVRRGDLVVFIQYFGFAYPDSLGEMLRERGAWVLQDSSQAVFQPPQPTAHFVLYSATKALGLPDGGILRSVCDVDVTRIGLEPAPMEWWLKSYSCRLRRAIYDESGVDLGWFNAFRELRRHAPIGPYRMSEFSRFLLENCIDWTSMATGFRQNFHTLQRRLGMPVTGAPSNDTVPTGYPLVLAKRDQLRAALIKQSVFPPVHWDIAQVVPVTFRKSHQLSSQIVTIPCDYRYTARDMERVVRQIRRWSNG